VTSKGPISTAATAACNPASERDTVCDTDEIRLLPAQPAIKQSPDKQPESWQSDRVFRQVCASV